MISSGTNHFDTAKAEHNMKRVRVNALYRYRPVFLDRRYPPYNVKEGTSFAL